MKSTAVKLGVFVFALAVMLLAPRSAVFAKQWHHHCGAPVATPGAATCDVIPEGEMTINGGATTVDSRDVVINLEHLYGRYVRLSESPAFGSEITVTLNEQIPAVEIPFTLSEGAGEKTIYGIVQGGCTASVIFSTTITFAPKAAAAPVTISALPIVEEPVYTPAYADGTLLRGYGVQIYVIVEGKKKHVETLEELRANYAGIEIKNVEDAVLDGIPDYVAKQ